MLHYSIHNLNNGYILFQGNDYDWAKHVWYSIPKRKTVTLVFVDNETGEILKTKYPKNQSK